MLISVKAFPDSKKQEIIKKSEQSFEIKVKEKPIAGAANRAIAFMLASYFEVPFFNVKLIKGFKQRTKTFNIKGL